MNNKPVPPIRRHFGDRLLAAVDERESHVVIGLDPRYELLPPALRERHEQRAYATPAERRVAAYREFLLGLLSRTAGHAVAVKPQLAYFEALGAAGYALYEELVQAAADLDLLVIADAKRGDIGSTAEAYAAAHLGPRGADAVTVNPWFGSDGVAPFLERIPSGHGVFLLVKTSNPSSAEIQDLTLADGSTVYERVALLVGRWGGEHVGESGYSSVGAVAGGTHPRELERIRALLPGIPLLIPGYGAQGAGADDVAGAFDENGTGAVVNSSRAILYAYRSRGGDWAAAAEAETAVMREALWRASGRS
ncbi:MAG: orotidine-5'-phosphate decarboxylase [Thermoleophilia bacterium]